MLSKVQKWGNRQGIRITKKLLENPNIKAGEEVSITDQEGNIIVEATHKIHGRYDIKNLVAKMPKNYEPKEENWGKPVGKEVW